MIKSIFKTVAIFLVVVISSTAYAKKKNEKDAKTQKKSELARVAIFPFTDNTKSEDYGYLSSSLVDAIDKKMRKGFEYQRANFSKIKTLYNYQSEVLVDKQIKKAAKLIEADIVIYGVYVFDETTNEIVISIDVYFPNIGEKKSLDPIRNPIDSTLFSASDRAADTIIIEITSTIEAHNRKIASKNKGNGEEIEKTKGKKKITTAALNTRRARTFKTHGFQSGMGQYGIILQYEVQDEKFPVNWFSSYGSFGVGIGRDTSRGITFGYIKIPFFSPLLLFAWPIALIAKKPLTMGSFPLSDGIAFHFRKPGTKTWLSIYSGAFFGAGYGQPDNSPDGEFSGTVGFEAGFRLYVKEKFVFNVAGSFAYPYDIGIKIGFMMRYGN
ncbi:MAG: hypothetical protein ABUK01_13630 [Leptospirales bacterium]